MEKSTASPERVKKLKAAIREQVASAVSPSDCARVQEDIVRCDLETGADVDH